MTVPTMPLHAAVTGSMSRRFAPSLAWRTLLVTVIGGVAMVTGALLPWMTFYAGLQPIAGTRGGYGKAVLLAGVAVCIVGAVRSREDARWTRVLLAVIGSSVVAGGALLLWRAWQLVSSQGALMLVPRLGPGLFVVIAGGLLILVSQALARRY
jgi:hypothetical protein